MSQTATTDRGNRFRAQRKADGWRDVRVELPPEIINGLDDLRSKEGKSRKAIVEELIADLVAAHLKPNQAEEGMA
ncbi:MAG: ribbon-helix-helix protein, CopG family [Pseudomonadota bacterium]